MVHSHIAMFLFRRETWAIFCDPRASDGRRWRDIEAPLPVRVATEERAKSRSCRGARKPRSRRAAPSRVTVTASFMRRSGINCAMCTTPLASGRKHTRVRDGDVDLWLCRTCGDAASESHAAAGTLRVPTRHVPMRGE